MLLFFQDIFVLCNIDSNLYLSQSPLLSLGLKFPRENESGCPIPAPSGLVSVLPPLKLDFSVKRTFPNRHVFVLSSDNWILLFQNVNYIKCEIFKLLQKAVRLIHTVSVMKNKLRVCSSRKAWKKGIRVEAESAICFISYTFLSPLMIIQKDRFMPNSSHWLSSVPGKSHCKNTFLKERNISPWRSCFTLQTLF